MLRSTVYRIVLIGAVLVIFVTACGGSQTSIGAQDSIEAYIEALVDKDLNQMINLSCAAWEADARLEHDSFAAVDVRLENLDCQVTGQEGDSALVSCSGKIIASYGAEDLEIDLGERVYLATEEGGDWRMCGYQ